MHLFADEYEYREAECEYEPSAGRLDALQLVSSLPISASCQTSWQGSNT